VPSIRFGHVIAALAFLVGCFGFAAPAAAQASRTWVSGTGDDVNPCSRTAPCKTFAGAISKTAAGGEINCLDPGGYGAVTIVKSMTISCPYTEGGALAGGNGITVNAGPTDVVVIRGLDIFGVNPPTHGVRFVAGGALHIEDSVIRRFNSVGSQGVSFAPSAASALYITNTTITGNGNGNSGGGILIQPTGAGGSAKVTMRDVRILDNANAAFKIDTTGNTAAAGITVTMEDSQMAGSAAGIVVNAPAGTTSATLMVNDSVIANNTFGLLASGATARIRVGDSTIHGNGTGVTVQNSAAINTYGNNRLDGNGADGAFTAPVIPTK
jgi:hypothetical protein